LEVARVIRTLEAASGERRMPIVMLTAAASTDLREESLDAGVDLSCPSRWTARLVARSKQLFSEPDHTTSDAPVSHAARRMRRPRLLEDMADLARDRLSADSDHKFSAEARRLLDLIEAAVIGGIACASTN